MELQGSYMNTSVIIAFGSTILVLSFEDDDEDQQYDDKRPYGYG